MKKCCFPRMKHSCSNPKRDHLVDDENLFFRSNRLISSSNIYKDDFGGEQEMQRWVLGCLPSRYYTSQMKLVIGYQCQKETVFSWFVIIVNGDVQSNFRRINVY